MNTNKTTSVTLAQSGHASPKPGQFPEKEAADSEAAYKSDLDNNPVQIVIERGWTPAKDRKHFESIWGSDINEGEDRYNFMLTRIGGNLDELSHTLNQAALFLSSGRGNPKVLKLLPIADKLDLLRKLFVGHISQVPMEHHRNYLFRFNDHLDQVKQIEALRRAVLLKFQLNPSNTWLSELVHVADWIATGQFEFQEGMDCEHDAYQSWRKKRLHSTTQKSDS